MLQAQAEQVRKAEVGVVVAKIKEAVKAYGLEPKDIFGARAATDSARTKTAIRTAAAYSDGQGNTWVGRGPRPQWLRDALAAGKKLEDFAVGGSKTAKAANGTAKRKATGKRKAGRIKFRDGSGNSWTGHGRKPQWFIDAIAGGKTPEDLKA